MSLLSTLKFVTSHPLNQKNKLSAVFRLMKWQLNTRLNPYPIVYSFTDKAKLIIQKGMTGATGNLYGGLHEYADMMFLVHLLRPEDCFVDVGANIGSYTILASAHVGATSYSFEPVPSTFANLMQNIAINQLQQKVKAYNIAIGSSTGEIGFNTGSFDTMHHVAEENEEKSIKVPVEKLDDVLRNNTLPVLIKIDVEGFETEVIKGAAQTLAQQGVKAIIIELNGAGSRYGFDERTVHDTLMDLQFKPFQYEPKTRSVKVVESFGSFNTIYIRDIPFVQQRLETAPVIRILGNEI